MNSRRMGLQPKLQRPEWWRTLNAGRKLLDPGVFASYRDDLSWKDLSGLKLSKTRYYCSEYAKNDIRLTKEYLERHYPRRSEWGYAFYSIIGPYNNVPSISGTSMFGAYWKTKPIKQNEPLKGIDGEIYEASAWHWDGRVGGEGRVRTIRWLTQYQTNDSLKRSPKEEEIQDRPRGGLTVPHTVRWDFKDFSFCEPDGVLKPVWQNFNLRNSSLKSADLRYIDLSSANLTGIQSGEVITNSDTKLPQDWIESGGFLLGPRADLRHQDLSGISIQNIDLSQAKLDDIKSQNLVGKPKKLPPNWSLHQLGGIIIMVY